VKKQIEEQENELAITQEKIVKFIETRVRELEKEGMAKEENKD